MDRHGGCMAEEVTGVKRRVLAKKTLGILALISLFSLLYSYFSGLSYDNIQFSTLIFSLFVHAMDRKYMFLICNGIVAFLVRNLSLSSSAGFVKTAEDSFKQIGEMPPMLVQENVASVEYGISSDAGEDEMDKQDECIYQAVREDEEEIKAEDEPEEEDDAEEVGENKAEDVPSTVEEVTDAVVSTEELNQKFEEFIRKMKEEIRIEAQQHLIAV